jgi:hypothetical protein
MVASKPAVFAGWFIARKDSISDTALKCWPGS